MHKKDVLSKTLWFEKRIKYNIDYFDILQPQRVVNEHPRYKSGVFFSEKCQREIQYESNMELEFIKLLEANKKVRFYFEQPVRIPYRRGRRNQTYTPDFALFLDTKEVVIVEIKDLSGMLDNRVQMKMEALLKFCSKRGFGLLFTDGKNTFDKILKAKCNKKLEKAMMNALFDHGSIRRSECRDIMKACHATRLELLKAIVRHNLRLRSRTLKIEPGNKNEIFRHVFIGKKSYDELLSRNIQILFK